jgi:putative membrane protein
LPLGPGNGTHRKGRDTYLNRGMVAAVLAVLMACSKGKPGTGDTGLETATSESASPAGAVRPPVPGMSDANIFYTFDRANVIDSAAGAVAVTKGTNSEVRDYARLMVRDHHDLRQRGADLAKRVAITPEPPPNDASQARMDRAMSVLNGAAKGRDFDKAYIDNEVETHKMVLETLTAAMGAAQNAELQNMIQKAAPTILGHFDMAQSIQRKLK